MTPKMQKILKDLKAEFHMEYGDCGERDILSGNIENLQEFVQRACIEYARTVIILPIKIHVTNRDPIMQERWDDIMSKIQNTYLEEIYSDEKDLLTNT